jgi:signal peptidase I
VEFGQHAADVNPDDFVIVNKAAYRLGSRRGDVIVFKYPPDPESEPYIKRVIGLPGDRAHIADGTYMSMATC